MDLRHWLVDELDDSAARLTAQVLSLIPDERRYERPGGGNSIIWGCYHVARHADGALAVLTGKDLILLAGEGCAGGGLEEAEQPWSAELGVDAVDGYLSEVLAAARSYLARVDTDEMDRVPDTNGALANAGISKDAFYWLYRMWSGKPVSFLIRWPLMGHVGNHVGEMIATRNRMGLSPF